MSFFMKRILDCQASDFAQMSGRDLKDSIRAAEGRTILSECIVSWTPLVRDVSNPEIARSFGADLLLLNFFDVDNPLINGLPNPSGEDVVRTLKTLTGRPVGINLEPVDKDAIMLDEKIDIPSGRTLSARTVARVSELGFDFICVTGNPKTGVTNEQIANGIQTIRSVCGNKLLIIAGKMHAAGTEVDWTEEALTGLAHTFAEAGADIILLPAPGTVPGVDYTLLRPAVKRAHELGALVMLAVGTSQEGADVGTIRQIALSSKMTGADVFHLGDAGSLGIAEPDNIMAASDTLRGRRHTLRRMAASPLR